MGTPAYAVVADLTGEPWNLTITDATAAKMLGYAARLVRRATLTAVYEPDTDGLPTDTELAAALKGATCSCVATWVALSADPAAGAADGGRTIAAKSRGAASIQYVAYASTAEARARAASSLPSDAMFILQEAGLAGGAPLVFG